ESEVNSKVTLMNVSSMKMWNIQVEHETPSHTHVLGSHCKTTQQQQQRHFAGVETAASCTSPIESELQPLIPELQDEITRPLQLLLRSSSREGGEPQNSQDIGPSNQSAAVLRAARGRCSAQLTVAPPLLLMITLQSVSQLVELREPGPDGPGSISTSSILKLESVAQSQEGVEEID
ncbi:unnamed protein product, partial [Pleuronectes platessa]